MKKDRVENLRIFGGEGREGREGEGECENKASGSDVEFIRREE